MMRSGLTLERELHELLGAGRNALIAARYYGFDGRGGESLQSVGNEIGVTRERIRQIVSRASESLGTRGTVPRTLDRTIAFVAGHMPAAAGQIETELRTQKLTSGIFRLEGVVKAAELLGRRLPFSITEVQGARIVHPRKTVDAIVVIARRVVSRWGMATVSDVLAEVRKVGLGAGKRDVAQVLASQRGFHWLDQSTGWFWLEGTAQNPVLYRTSKMQSVANPMCVSELRAGPPKRVLLEFCRQAPGLSVNNEIVKPKPAIRSNGVMTQIDLTLERELHNFLGTGRNAGIAARYYGFDGQGGTSLQAVGDEIGLTRERVRQIVARATQWLNTRPPPSPTLDQALAFVADRIPAAAREIEAELRSQKLTSGIFRLEGVIEAAELLGRRVPFSMTEVNGERLVHARGIRALDTIFHTARRVVTRRGMATVSGVATEVRRVDSRIGDESLVAQALASREGFHWLDRSAGWFWLEGNRENPVLHRIRKILSVANPINISELRAGIGRDRLMQDFSPPRRVFLEFCRQSPGLRVSDETVKAEPVISSDDVLTRTESDIVRKLSEHGGPMAGSELKSACLGMGMKRVTFYSWMMYSPIIARYAGGRYGLIGLAGNRSRYNGSSLKHG